MTVKRLKPLRVNSDMNPPSLCVLKRLDEEHPLGVFSTSSLNMRHSELVYRALPVFFFYSFQTAVREKQGRHNRPGGDTTSTGYLYCFFMVLCKHKMFVGL